MPDSDQLCAVRPSPLRAPDEVMRLRRLGAAFPTRLSLMRILTRRMARERWTFAVTHFDLDETGHGTGVWRIDTPGGALSFVAFSTPLRPDERTDRVIADKWDVTAVLCRGAVAAEEVERLRENAPRQEAGRYTSRDLVLTRANRSSRLFDAVVSSLAAGRQPDWDALNATGYLMRTTAVYGNGKFGLADYPCTAANPSVSGAFLAEMLTVYLVREFQCALVERLANPGGGTGAVSLSADRARALGIGNATGLGMAPFLVRHPALLHAWAVTRERAIAAVLARQTVRAGDAERFQALLERAAAHCGQWRVDDGLAMGRIADLRGELTRLREHGLAGEYPFRALFGMVQRTCSVDTQELVAALVIELGGEDVDLLEDGMLTAVDLRPGVALSLDQLIETIARHYGWALRIAADDASARQFFWYYSANKEEPRLGERAREEGADREMPVGTGLEVAALHRRLCALTPREREETVASFVLREPRWYRATKRALLTAALPYSDVRDNLIGAGMRPVDLLRFKLSIFGATRFDPKSDLWTRVTMFQGAPRASELATRDADDWWLPAPCGVCP